MHLNGYHDEEGQFVNSQQSSSHNGTPMTMAALEMEVEEEQESLLDETLDENTPVAGQSRAASQLKFRKVAAARAVSVISAPHRVLGFLRERIGHHFTYRNVALLGLLTILVVVAMRVDSELESEYLPEDVLPKSPHQSSFWDALPKSNVNGQEVPSIAIENWRNDVGFYLHHPFASPFADALYDMSNSTKANLQLEFDSKRQATVAKYGMWIHPNTEEVAFPKVDPFPEVSLSTFKSSAWQVNAAYLKAFLSEGRKLVQRVQTGIYNEYGYSNLSSTEVTELFGTTIVKNQSEIPELVRQQQGVAILTESAWEALIRKLWHAILTHDTFFVVTVGDPGSHVNFARTSAMQFHYLLEPVLDMLGVRLITRNMGGHSPTISALGGGDVWGETDLLVVYNDDSLSEGERELLQRQSILAGERVPIIMASSFASVPPPPDLLLPEAWLGRILTGKRVCPLTTRTTDGGMPRACEYLNCDLAARRYGKCKVYNDFCWVDRIDYEPSAQESTVETDEYISSVTPPLNDVENQWEGRKLALMILHALEETLQRWNEEVSSGRTKLADNLWQVSGAYQTLREQVRTHRNRAGGSTVAALVGPTPCESFLAGIDPMICHMRMHLLTEWTPRVDFDDNGLKAFIASEIVDPFDGIENVYRGYDLLPLPWRQLDSNGVDVHLIAIATNETLNEFKEQTVGQDNTGERRLSRFTKRKPQPQGDSKWVVYNAPIGFCDGSSQSTCNRRSDNACLLANRNFYRAGMLGNSQSGWLHFNVPAVSEGVILLRLDWTTDLGVEGAKAGNLRSDDRLESLPKDFRFDFSIGNDVKSLSRSEFLNFGKKLSDDLVVYPVLMSREMPYNVSAANQQVDVGMRVQSEWSGSSCKILLTHVYYA